MPVRPLVLCLAAVNVEGAGVSGVTIRGGSGRAPAVVGGARAAAVMA